MRETNINVEKTSRSYAYAMTTPRKEIIQRINSGVTPKIPKGLPVKYEGIEITFDDDGNRFYKGKPLRGEDIVSQAMCNLAGAHPYLVDVMSYALTHFPKNVASAQDYYAIRMGWPTFLDLALDGIKGQTNYLRDELQKISKVIQGKAIALKDKNNTVIVGPVMFVVIERSFEATERLPKNQQLIARTKLIPALDENGKQLTGTNKEGKKVKLYTMKQEGEAIAWITIYALKALFKGIRANRTIIDLPKAFFAKIVNATVSETINKESIAKLCIEGTKSVCTGHGQLFANINPEYTFNGFTLTPTMLYKATLYIRLHDNGQRQMCVPAKDSEEDGRHFLRHVAPRYIEATDKNGKEELKYCNGGKKALECIAKGLTYLSENEHIAGHEGYNPHNLITSVIVKDNRLVVTYGNRPKQE